MRGAETADRVWREVAGFRGPGLSETSRPFDAFTPKKKKKWRQAERKRRRWERNRKWEKKEWQKVVWRGPNVL